MRNAVNPVYTACIFRICNHLPAAFFITYYFDNRSTLNKSIFQFVLAVYLPLAPAGTCEQIDHLNIHGLPKVIHGCLILQLENTQCKSQLKPNVFSIFINFIIHMPQLLHIYILLEEQYHLYQMGQSV